MVLKARASPSVRTHANEPDPFFLVISRSTYLNLFAVSLGRVGKQFVLDINRLSVAYAQSSALESVAFFALMVLPTSCKDRTTTSITNYTLRAWSAAFKPGPKVSSRRTCHWKVGSSNSVYNVKRLHRLEAVGSLKMTIGTEFSPNNLNPAGRKGQGRSTLLSEACLNDALGPHLQPLRGKTFRCASFPRSSKILRESTSRLVDFGKIIDRFLQILMFGLLSPTRLLFVSHVCCVSST